MDSFGLLLLMIIFCSLFCQAVFDSGGDASILAHDSASKLTSSSIFSSRSIRLNLKFKIFPKTLPINGTFALSFPKTVNGHFPILTTFVGRTDTTVPPNMPVAVCQSTIDEKIAGPFANSIHQKVILHWLLQPSGLDVVLYDALHGTPLSANSTGIALDFFSNNSYYIGFAFFRQTNRCLSDLTVCRQSYNFNVGCPNGNNSIGTIDDPNPMSCLHKIEYDSDCCHNDKCNQFCTRDGTHDVKFSKHTPTTSVRPSIPIASTFIINTVSVEENQPDPSSNTMLNMLDLKPNATVYTNTNITYRRFSQLSITTPATIHRSNACASIPCKNGICHVLPLYYNNGSSPDDYNTTIMSNKAYEPGVDYSCVCQPRYYGLNCQFTDPCFEITCLHNGSCQVVDSGLDTQPEFKCVCRSGFSGEKCQTALISSFHSTVPATSTISALTLNPCGLSPCLNNGTCIVSNHSSAGFFCQCFEGWSDDLCQSKVTPVFMPLVVTSTTQRIEPFDCRHNASYCNHGICVASTGRCNCNGTGFTGSTCDVDIDECKSNPCFNNASCINTFGLFECFCLPGFSGFLCTDGHHLPETSRSTTNLGAKIGGAFGGLILIGALIGVYFLYKYVSRSRRLKGKYNPAREEMSNVGGHPVPLATLNTGERLI